MNTRQKLDSLYAELERHQSEIKRIGSEIRDCEQTLDFAEAIENAHKQEREACAKIAEKYVGICYDESDAKYHKDSVDSTLEMVARLIRERTSQ